MANCFTSIRGRRMRVTRVDTLGRPVPGLCSTVTTGGFVKIDMKAEVQAGDETTVTTASGDLCVSEKACDQLKWLTVDIDFCKVDPDLFSLINPNWVKLLDHNGQTIGWEESYTYSCDSGFALEIWADVSGYTVTDPNAAGAWVYYLLPFVVGGTLGDLTVENGAATFTLSGQTKKGSQWGKGPYNVMANPPDGTCGPLITPFSPNAPRRIFLTTCAPPVEVCGCQPLSSADGPTVTLAEDTTDTNRLSVHAYASGAGPFTVDWGDGTVEDLPAGLTGKTHTYGRLGTYVVSVYATSTPDKATYTSITVPYTGTPAPSPLLVDITEDTADATRQTATIQWANTGFGTVRIDLGDGSPILTAQTESGSINHLYTSGGQYVVTITDETDSSRNVSRTVTAPFGLLISVAEDTADTVDHRSINVTVNNVGHGTVQINWGDGSPSTANVGDNVSVSKHKYATGGTYTITVTDADESTRTGTSAITVPFGPTIVATEYLTDTKRMSISTTVNSHGHGAVTLNWGDATSTGTNVGDGTTATTHKYLNEGTYTVTATDTDDPTWHATKSVTVPFGTGLALTATVAESSPAGTPRRKVTLTWDNQGQGPVKILFGQPPTGEVASDGTDAGTMDHTYTADGTYTITVTDASNSARSITRSVTVPFTG